VPLTLVAASFDAGTVLLTLTFSRAVDVGGIVPGEFVVLDGDLGVEWGGTFGEISQPTPESVAMFMIENGPFAGAGVTLTVGAANGIVAQGDGAPFAGVADLVLPFP
jgi:hypothetical protein